MESNDVTHIALSHRQDVKGLWRERKCGLLVCASLMDKYCGGW